MKKLYEHSWNGRNRYAVRFHDGVKTHKDGSEFYDIRLFSNKIVKNKFIADLIRDGYSWAQ